MRNDRHKTVYYAFVDDYLWDEVISAANQWMYESGLAIGFGESKDSVLDALNNIEDAYGLLIINEEEAMFKRFNTNSFWGGMIKLCILNEIPVTNGLVAFNRFLSFFFSIVSLFLFLF